MKTARTRRSPEAAREHILRAASGLLAEGGPQHVQVRAVARAAGMTDGGVLHHFNDRDALMRALLEHQAIQLRSAIGEAARAWRDEADLVGLIDLLAEAYRGGQARLALELYEAGWRDRGKPLLAPVVEALLGAYPRAPADEVRVAVAAIHQWLAFDPLFGPEFRRSVGGMPMNATSLQRAWYVSALQRTLRRRT